MSELFEKYEQEYSDISASISRKIHAQIPSLVGESRKTATRAVERELDEAIEILQSMERQLNELPPTTKTRLQPRLRNYKSDYEKLKADFKKAAMISERDQLLGVGVDGGASNSNDLYNTASLGSDQRGRLLAGTNRLNDASRRLEDSHRLALEAEDTGLEALNSLRMQRQQMEHAHSRLDEANSFMDRNIRILKGMAQRAAANRVLSVIIIIVLLIAISLILVIKFS